MRVPLHSNGGVSSMTLRQRQDRQDEISLQLHPIPSRDALIVKVQPPVAPLTNINHVPCDIVLVIDVSGSMGLDAPIPGEGETSERTGLSVLDLVKHAALTIIELMDETDRLGIVTFATSSHVEQTLLSMTPTNKEKARGTIKNMQPRDSTNLWHGIKDGISLFRELGPAKGSVPAIMVLTDGLPNHMCPPQGYIPKLRTMLPLPASIHTFGFGYSLRSGLLKSIAEIGNGNYAFIPDAGMIGTVFVHAVANLQATYATEAVLKLSYTAALHLKPVMGETVDQKLPKRVNSTSGLAKSNLTLQLGIIQFGQSRDIWFKIDNLFGSGGVSELGQLDVVEASLSYERTTATKSSSRTNTAGPDLHRSLVTQASFLSSSDMPENEVAYHESRARICTYLSMLFPIGPNQEHKEVMDIIEPGKFLLDDLIANLPAARYDDVQNQSLMSDLAGEEPQGQVSLAIGNPTYFTKWGRHYLPSLLNAHQRQICNTFKDKGPLQYGTQSPLFIKCRDELDAAFDNLPPPEPSIIEYGTNYGRGVVHAAPVSMSRYNMPLGPCFAGSTRVELASGRTVPIRRLRRGVKVKTPAGVRKVAAVLKTPVEKEMLCRIGDVFVTPWHPISLDDSKAWQFPAHVAEGAVRYTGAIYSVLLQRDKEAEAHAIRVGGIWGVTLGHGIIAGDDVRAHQFLGDYSKVGKSLARLGSV